VVIFEVVFMSAIRDQDVIFFSNKLGSKNVGRTKRSNYFTFQQLHKM